MKKTILHSIFLFALVACSISASAQTPSKEQLIKEINQLFASCKLWDYEGIVMDNTGSMKYHICLNPECNPFVSWDFYIKNLKPVEVAKSDEYTVIKFTCKETDCIIPTGYEKGGRYDMKTVLEFIINDKKKGQELADKLNVLQKMELGK